MINPVAFMIQSVVAPQFARRDCTGPYPEGDCPSIKAERYTFSHFLSEVVHRAPRRFI
jgi:hypothetical protein